MNLIELRHLLHHQAEMSFCEYKTKEILLQEIKNHRGKQIELDNSASFLVYYDYGSSKTVMLRAEMDGLAISEKTGKEYASCHDGVMHACGHDGHMAILCGVSQKLSETNFCPVNVLLVFQEAEETGGGAKKVLGDPQFLRICPDEALALHVMPGLPHGEMFVRYGVTASGGKEIDLRWTGKSAHCAHRTLADDALEKGVRFMNDLYHQTFYQGFISINKMRAGKVRNQIADECELSGTMRFQSSKTQKEMIHWLKNAAADAELVLSAGYPVLSCSQHMVLNAIEAGAKVLKEALWICDDFACYAECIPSVYVLMGMNSEYDLHHSCFDFSDDLIETGVDYLMKIILNNKTF